MRNNQKIYFSLTDKMTPKSEIHIRRQYSKISIKRTFCDSVSSFFHYGLISFLLVIGFIAHFSSAEEWLRNTYNTRYVL